MKVKKSAALMLILTVLILATLFVSPVNREPLSKEYGNSGIEDWEYMSWRHELSEKLPANFAEIENSREPWTSLGMLESDLNLDGKMFWLRGRLPENMALYSPALFLEFDFPVEVFIDGYRVYSYGTMEDRDRVLSFKHLIPLHEEYEGKMIYFRYPKLKGLDIKGLRHLSSWDMVSGSVKIKSMLEQETLSIILCTSGAFIGLCLIVIALFQKSLHKDEGYIMAYAGAFVLLISLNIISTFYSVRSALDRPVLIFYFDYLSYFLIPCTAGTFIAGIIRTGPKAEMKVINTAFALYLIFVMVLSLVPGFDISRADFVFNTMLLTYALFMVYLMLKELRCGNKDLKVILAGLVITGVTGMLDILIELKVISYSGDFAHYGIFILSLCMAAFFGLRYSGFYAAAKAANLQLSKSKQLIEEINRNLDRKVIEKTSAIKSLFDNAEQGFLSFKNDLRVENEYSLKCREIFGCDISGENVPKLLSGGDREQENFVGDLLQKVFSMQEAGRREVYITLLPTELNVNGKLINISYKLIDKHDDILESKFMMILTDITERHTLEQKLEQERSILRMGVKVVANHNDFVNAISDYKDFCCNRIMELLDSDIEAGSKYIELFRSIHTFKGTFAQFDMQNTARKLHDFETTIDCFRKANHSIEDLKGLLQAGKPEEWLQEDLATLREILGERYLGLDKLITVEESKLKEIEDKILALFEGDESLTLVNELRELRYRSFNDMLRHYPEYCLRLSERLEKPINDFQIEGPDIAVDPDRYKELGKVMAHLFRNAMDHGIEAPEERIKRGKPEIGNISCSIRFESDAVKISVCDDGAGIDIQEIRKRAIEERGISLNEAATSEEIAEVLFTDGFTTADKINELSGRGVGLSAVKAEVEKLNGMINIVTTKGQGTCFNISVPLTE